MSKKHLKLVGGIIFLIFLIIGIFTHDEKSAKNPNSQKKDNTSLISKYCGVYLCKSKSTILRLGSDGNGALTIEGDVHNGQWYEGVNRIIVFNPEHGASSRFQIANDGDVLVEDKYGFSFEKISN